MILAILSLVSGLINSPWFYRAFGVSFSTLVFFREPEIPTVNLMVAGISTGLALAGILAAWLVYAKKIVNTEKMAKQWNGVYSLLYNRFYIDEVYEWGFNKILLLFGRILDWVDHYLIDGLFDGTARLVGLSGKKLRFTQTGYLQSYALIIFTAVVLIVLLMATPILRGVLK